MSEYGFLNRLRDFLGSRRFVWIFTIALAVLLVLYMLFVTLFFNPFEAKLDDTATIVPSRVDYFVRWRDAGNQFGEFPEPAVWSEFQGSTAYDEASASGALMDLGASSGISAMLNELGQVSRYLPVGLSLKSDFLSEIAIAGRGELRLDNRFVGMVMMRASFKVKAGVSMLGFDFVRDKLPEGIQIEDVGDGVYRLPQFEPFGFQDAYLGRVKDVLILASREEFLSEAQELDARSGQDSLAQASNFHDNVTAYLGPDDTPIEVFLRWDKIGPQAGRWPDPNSQGLASRFIGRLFDTEMLRYLAGYLDLDTHLQLRLRGDIDASRGDDFQKAWLQGPALGAHRIKEFASMTPANAFAFVTLAGDPSKVLVEAYDLVAGDLRNSLDRAVADSGQYQGMFHLLQDIGSVYKPGLALILRNNSYVEDESSPEHDDTPVPLFAIVGKVDDPGALDRVQHFFEAHWASFTGNHGDETIQRLSNQGGAEGLSFVSTVIPGTGEIVLLHILTLDTVVLTNSDKFAFEILGAGLMDDRSVRSESLLLSRQESFVKAIEGSSNGAHVFLWMDPGNGKEWLEESSIGAAQDAFRLERESDWKRLRPQEEKRLREEMFGGRMSLSPTENARLMAAIDEAVLAADTGAAQRLPVLTAEARRDWLPTQMLDWFSLGFRVNRRHAELYIQGAIAD
jgi:hypothetical protein